MKLLEWWKCEEKKSSLVANKGCCLYNGEDLLVIREQGFNGIFITTE